jgi:hypothetical protein
MKQLALTFALSLTLFLDLNAHAQSQVADDSSAVRSTVTNYIEAYYTGDAARMAQTLHPH